MSDILNADFETEFAPEEATEVPQLGIKPSTSVNRRLLTQDKIGSTSFSATLSRIQYGTYKDSPACLVVIDFTFRFKPKTASRYEQAQIEVSFTRAVDPSNPKLRNTDPDLDPKVVNLAPKTVYGQVRTTEVSKTLDITIPTMFESPIGISTGVELHAGMERTTHEESRMEIHGQLFEDNNHVEGANAVSWDLFENRVQKDGILRNFRAVVILETPPAEPMWMHVTVKPSVAFSVNPLRLFDKSNAFIRLLQLNDAPVLLDGKTPKRDQEDLGCDNFSSSAYPWPKVLRMPVEYQSKVSVNTDP